MPTLERCHNIADLRRRARRRLPSPMFHYLDGGADDEWTLRRNTAAFDDYPLMPRQLTDISSVDLSTRVLGLTLDWPVFLAPTGMSRLFHHGAEPAVARAAAASGTLYSLSTMGTTSIEDIARVTRGPKMFQIYILKDRSLTSEFVDRCRESGYDALCLTVDAARAGNRERDLRTGMTMPPRFTPRSLASFALSPHWAWHLMRHPDFRLANVEHRVDVLSSSAMSLIDYLNTQFDRTVTWHDVEWLRSLWTGPLVVKGLQSVADVRTAAGIGVDAVMLSNHGGRQLEGAPAPIDCLAPARDAVGADIELIVDGGIRRGTHVVKALALGADACSIGRAYLYGLAAGGEAGVARALGCLKLEVERTMALAGRTRISQLGPETLAAGNPRPHR